MLMVLKAIILFVVFVIVFNIIISFYEHKQKLKAKEQLKKIIYEHGNNVLYECRGAIEGICYDEIIINKMKNNVCIGKDFYYYKDNEWIFYSSQNVEWVWNQFLNKHGYSKHEGENYLRVCRVTKNEVVTNLFMEEWFHGYDNIQEYFKGKRI